MSSARMQRFEGACTLDRRRFLKGSVVGALSVGAGSSVVSAGNPAKPSWDLETDVLVVGTGAAGCCAALAAQHAGARVTLLEKAAHKGGTTLKSQGIYWVPNNTRLRALGAEDPREDALRYMARVSYPQLYDADASKLGLPDAAYELIAAYYDNASRVVDWLHEITALTSIFYPGPSHVSQLPDYYSHLPEDREPQGGRALAAANERGEPIGGAGLVRELHSAIEVRSLPLLLSHRALRLTMQQGRVAGLVAENPSGAAVRIRALRGVVLATGGFTHNAELTHNFLRGPILGGCAMPAAEGDAIAIAGEAGAALGNMNNAWWTPVLLEEAARNSAVSVGVFNLPGAAMIQVNRHGRRFVSEKAPYNERTQAQFLWDAYLGEFQNLVGIMIYDADAAWEAAGSFPVPKTTASHVIRGETLAQLEAKLRRRLAELSEHTSGIQLSEHFEFSGVQMTPAPTRPVPIYIGGVSIPALRRTARLGDGWLGPGQTLDDAIATARKLTELRAEYGRSDEPLDMIVPVYGECSPDDFKRMEDAGITSAVSLPFAFTVAPSTTLEQKRAYLEGYANGVIAVVND